LRNTLREPNKETQIAFMRSIWKALKNIIQTSTNPKQTSTYKNFLKEVEKFGGESLGILKRGVFEGTKEGVKKFATDVIMQLLNRIMSKKKPKEEE